MSQEESSQPATTTTTEKIYWAPVECSPEGLTELITSYGVTDTIINEVYGEELFDMIPQPIEALIVLYPCDEKIVSYIDSTFPVDNSANLIHIEQHIGNACGTFALTHFALNCRQIDEFTPSSPFEHLACQLTTATTAEERVKLFYNTPGIQSLHESKSEEGQTKAEDYVNTDVHYITFFERNGTLWLLDGGKKGPLNCGPCEPDNVLHTAFAIAKQLHQLWGKETDFAVLAATRLD